MSELATLKVSEQRGVPIVSVKGEIDASNADQLLQRLTGVVSNASFGVVIDLTDTSYLDSAGVHVLFDIAQRLRRRQQDLHVVVPRESFVADVLAAVNLAELATLGASVADAVAAAAEPT